MSFDNRPGARRRLIQLLTRHEHKAALVCYDDWLKNGSDVWVARLGAPVKLANVESIAISHSAGARKSNAYSFSDLRPHIISLGNNGQLNAGGDFGTSEEQVSSIFVEDFPTITKSWKKKRLLLYALGGQLARVHRQVCRA